MSWQEVTTVTLRREFCELADQEEANMSALCARFGISRKTGYKWLTRWRADGAAGLGDCSAGATLRRVARWTLRDVLTGDVLLAASTLKTPPCHSARMWVSFR
jgi:transposase-like protein